jgi:hypothetical protein
MNTEERDFQIEDNVDFDSVEASDHDLTPEVTDFEDSRELPTDTEFSADPDTEELTNVEEDPEISNQDIQSPEWQKETPSSNTRVMRYEDFVKNI